MLGIIIGGAIFALMIAITAGQTDYLRDKLVDVSPHITVTADRIDPVNPRMLLDTQPQTVMELVVHTPPSRREELKPYTELLAKIERASPAVLAVAPYVTGEGVLRNGTRFQTVTVRGIESEREKYIGKLVENIRHGRLESLRGTPDGVVIGSGLGRKLRVGAGDDVDFVIPSGTIQKLRVVAIFESGVANMDDRRAYINLPLAQSLRGMSRNAVSGISVQVRDLDNVHETQQTIQNAVGYEVDTWEESNAQILSFQDRQRITTRILVVLVFITAAFGIANTLVAIVLQKKTDIAIMKSFGVTRGGVVRIFLIEGVVLGIIGGLLAALLGYLLATLFGQFSLFPQNNPNAYLRFEKFPVALDTWIFALTFGLSVLMAIVASIAPARRAAKFVPVRILRGEV
jgi:lipoprotein-releasing system permease protein